MHTRRRLAAAVLAALVLVVPLAACSGGSDAVTDVTASQAAEVLADSTVTVVDVRTPQEYAEGHLPGAVNIDVESGSFDQQIQQLPTDGSYFVYCRSGNRSGVATDTMAQLGFTDVYDLQGGIIDWQAAGGQVVTG
jgi:rhodanese-related sulfurtransferase